MSKIWVRLVLWLTLLAVVVAVGYKMSVKNPKEQETLNGLVVSHNALMPISPIEFPHTLVLASKITFCESSDRHEGIWGDNGKAFGKWQFHEKTFYWLAGLAGYKNVNWKNEADQDLVGMWALENGYGYLWSCFNKVK